MFASTTAPAPTFTSDADTTALVETIALSVAARPATVRRILGRYGVADHVLGFVGPLGLVDRLAAGPALLETTDPWSATYALTWRLDQPTPDELLHRDGRGRRVDVSWTVRLGASATGGTLVTATIRVAGADDDAGEDVANALGPISGVCRTLATQLLTQVRAIAQDADELAWEAALR